MTPQLSEDERGAWLLGKAIITFLLTAILSACGEMNTDDASSSVIARSNEVDVGDDNADLQFAAFELLSGMTREAAETVLEQQDFECDSGVCLRLVRYRDSFLAANYGIGQRTKQDGSPLNQRYESTTLYSIRVLSSQITEIEDLEARVIIRSNYHGG
ncbi:MAG: hypothetical protein HC869_15990 [Rhodospirillales bacterium]|nr:hypothetical protein [Rhodospirillales bacterium]